MRGGGGRLRGARWHAAHSATTKTPVDARTLATSAPPRKDGPRLQRDAIGATRGTGPPARSHSLNAAPAMCHQSRMRLPACFGIAFVLSLVVIVHCGPELRCGAGTMRVGG